MAAVAVPVAVKMRTATEKMPTVHKAFLALVAVVAVLSTSKPDSKNFISKVRVIYRLCAVITN